LLISLPSGSGNELLNKLHEEGIPGAAMIGTIEEGAPGITV
jgi:hypothetical protein